MLFSQAIPDKVLETPNTQGFMEVLDGLHVYKTEEMARSLRVFNPILCPSNKWLAAQLGDYGIKNIPDSYPIAPLQQVLINIDPLRRLLGSQLGVTALLSTLTLGEVAIDDSRFIRKISLVYPVEDNSTLVDGNQYVTDDSTDTFLPICDDNSPLLEGTFLGITIKSIYFDGNHPVEAKAIETFLKDSISSFVGFQDFTTITWNFEGRDSVFYHNLLNKYYV